MSYVRCLRGLVSGIEYSADTPMNLDPADMWRFGALMALDIRDPRDAAHIVALGEGAAPVLD